MAFLHRRHLTDDMYDLHPDIFLCGILLHHPRSTIIVTKISSAYVPVCRRQIVPIVEWALLSTFSFDLWFQRWNIDSSMAQRLLFGWLFPANTPS
jgi:hypothetical protein